MQGLAGPGAPNDTGPRRDLAKQAPAETGENRTDGDRRAPVDPVRTILV